MNESAATYSIDKFQGVHLTMTQAALEAIARGEELSFGGVTVSAVNTAPQLVRNAGWVSHPVINRR